MQVINTIDELKKQKQEIIERIEAEHREHGYSVGGISLTQVTWENLKKEILKE